MKNQFVKIPGSRIWINPDHIWKITETDTNRCNIDLVNGNWHPVQMSAADFIKYLKEANDQS